MTNEELTLFNQMNATAAGRCVCPIELLVAPDFTGRVIVHMQGGQVLFQERLLPNVRVATLEGFIQLATEAGFMRSTNNEKGE